MKYDLLIFQSHLQKLVKQPQWHLLLKEDVIEVVIPAFEGEIGILKDHISIISFLKPGIIKIFSKSEESNFYVEDGIVEFKDNNLSILTSSIFNIKNLEKSKIEEIIQKAENDSKRDEINDQQKYLIDQKIDVLKSIN